MQFAAVFAVILGLSVTVTKAVDFVRNLPSFKGKWVGGWQWNAVAFVIGVGLCVGFQKDFVGDLMRAVPALAPDADKLSGQAGYVLSGVFLGALSGFGHEVLDAFSGLASLTHARAGGNSDPNA